MQNNKSVKFHSQNIGQLELQRRYLPQLLCNSIKAKYSCEANFLATEPFLYGCIFQIIVAQILFSVMSTVYIDNNSNRLDQLVILLYNKLHISSLQHQSSLKVTDHSNCHCCQLIFINYSLIIFFFLKEIASVFLIKQCSADTIPVS